MTLYQPKIIPFSHLFQIQSPFDSAINQNLFLNTVQNLVDEIIPSPFWQYPKKLPLETVFFELYTSLPLFQISKIDRKTRTLTISYLISNNKSQIIKDFFSQRLKTDVFSSNTCEFLGGIHFQFAFTQKPDLKFFIAQENIKIHDDFDIEHLKEKLDIFLDNLKKIIQEDNFITSSKEDRLFLPRNEEELMRNFILVSNQLKYVKDIPQVTIHFDRQSENSIHFIITIARLIKDENESIEEILSKSTLGFVIQTTKTLGHLKQKHLKQTSILNLELPKSLFYRYDRSIDVLKARLKISSELNDLFGEFRDFNGGMLLKQQEAFQKLKKQLNIQDPKELFLLEEYFYSIKPFVMQSVHETDLLQKHFLLLKSMDQEKIKLEIYEKFLIGFIKSQDPNIEEQASKIFKNIDFDDVQLTTCKIKKDQTIMLGLILKITSSNKIDFVIDQISSGW